MDGLTLDVEGDRSVFFRVRTRRFAHQTLATDNVKLNS